MDESKSYKRRLLEEYEREIQELRIIISRLKRELGISAESHSTESDSTNEGGSDFNDLGSEDIVEPGDFFGMSQAQACREFLHRKKRAATLKEIAEALFKGKATETLIKGENIRNLSSVLSRAKDEFICVARGKWGLVEWYPNRSRKKGKKNDSANDSATNDSKPEGDNKAENIENEGRSAE